MSEKLLDLDATSIDPAMERTKLPGSKPVASRHFARVSASPEANSLAGAKILMRFSKVQGGPTDAYAGKFTIDAYPRPEEPAVRVRLS